MILRLFGGALAMRISACSLAAIFMVVFGVAQQQQPRSTTNPHSAGNAIEEAARAATANGDGRRELVQLRPIDVLSDTMGIDFGPYLAGVLQNVQKNWYRIIPASARAPLMKKGEVSIEFAILKNGQTAGLQIVGTSGDVALDRAAYGGITASKPFPPLPTEFGGQYLALRFHFFYNPEKTDPQGLQASNQHSSASQGASPEYLELMPSSEPTKVRAASEPAVTAVGGPAPEDVAGVWIGQYPIPNTLVTQSYEFRPDGTCVFNLGGHPSGFYKHIGDTVAVAFRNKPVSWKLNLTADTLTIQFLQDVPGCSFKRGHGPASGSDLLVGTWKSESCNVPVVNPLQYFSKLLGSNALWTFSQDETVQGQYGIQGQGRYSINGSRLTLSCGLSYGTAPQSSELIFSIVNGNLLLVGKNEDSVFVKHISDPAQMYVPGIETPENNRFAQSAIDNYKQNLERNPQDLRSTTGLAHLYDLLHNGDDAKQYYRRAIALDPDGPAPYYMIGLIDWQETFQARMAERVKLGLKPDDPLLDKGVCQRLQEKNSTRIGEAMSMMEKAFQLRPVHDYVATYLGLLWREKADLECEKDDARAADSKKAEEWLQRAEVSVDPDKRIIRAWTFGPAPVNGGSGGSSMGGVIGGIINSTPVPVPRPTTPQRVRVSEGVTQGLLIKKVEPNYPPLAQQARIQGSVILQAEIGKDGTIKNLSLISGHPMLVSAAIEAVKQWQYKPYILNGEAVEVETQITVNFTLSAG
jgi:TonB family protein